MKNTDFLSLFSNGIPYDEYLKRSDRHLERMGMHEEEAKKLFNDLPYGLVQRLNEPMKVLCIAENFCGDCANGVPIISTIASKMENWDYKVLPRDSFLEIVEENYATAGRNKIPVIIFATPDGYEMNRWVERPTNSYRILADLQDKRLPKEIYIEQYRSDPEMKPPILTKIIFDELINCALRSISLYHILPNK